MVVTGGRWLGQGLLREVDGVAQWLYDGNQMGWTGVSKGTR